MNLRWLWFDYVDPQLHLTREQRRSVRKMAYRYMLEGRTDPNQPHRIRSTGTPPWIRIVAAIVLCFMPVVILVGALMIGVPRSTAFFLPLYAGMGWFAIAAMGDAASKPAIIIALRQHGYDVCINCSYLLRGLPLTVTHCPECGTKRDNP